MNQIAAIIEIPKQEKFENNLKYVFKKDVLIITNTKVGKLYLSKTKRLFKEYKVNSLLLPDGEKYKNNETSLRRYGNFYTSRYNKNDN